jgi:hypothetical protein
MDLFWQLDFGNLCKCWMASQEECTSETLSVPCIRTEGVHPGEQDVVPLLDRRSEFQLLWSQGTKT